MTSRNQAMQALDVAEYECADVLADPDSTYLMRRHAMQKLSAALDAVDATQPAPAPPSLTERLIAACTLITTHKTA